MSENLIENIKEEIEKSGHSVSLKSSLILNENGWTVKSAPRYFNSYLKEFREIDIIAEKQSPLIKYSTDVLIIECKKSKDKPWVFFKQPGLNVDIHSFNVDLIESTEGAVYDILEKKLLKQHYYYKTSLCTYHFVAFAASNTKKINQIFEATTQVLNALKFYLSQRINFYKEYNLEPRGPTFFYPVIVFDGKLFEVSINKEEYEIEAKDHISLLIDQELDEPFLRRVFNRPERRRAVFSKPFIIDIVTLNYLPKFLKDFPKAKEGEN